MVRKEVVEEEMQGATTPEEDDEVEYDELFDGLSSMSED